MLSLVDLSITLSGLKGWRDHFSVFRSSLSLYYKACGFKSFFLIIHARRLHHYLLSLIHALSSHMVIYLGWDWLYHEPLWTYVISIIFAPPSSFVSTIITSYEHHLYQWHVLQVLSLSPSLIPVSFLVVLWSNEYYVSYKLITLLCSVRLNLKRVWLVFLF